MLIDVMCRYVGELKSLKFVPCCYFIIQLPSFLIRRCSKLDFLNLSNKIKI